MKTNIGVYKITNIKNNKVYVGSSINLKSRKYNHYNQLKKDKHENKYLQNSYNKYGKENFIFQIVERLEFNEDKKILKKNLLEREQYWIDRLKCYNRNKGYNLCKIAGNCLGKKHSEESKLKMRKIKLNKKLSENHKDKIKKSKIGHLVSEETRQKISESNKNKFVSEETKEKLRQANLGKKQSEETKKKKGDSLRGKKRSQEFKDKMSKIAKEREVSENFKKSSSHFTKGNIPHNKGKQLSEEHKAKLKEAWIRRKEREKI